MWCIELAGFLAAGTGEFCDEILVDIAENVVPRIVVEVNAVDAFDQLRQRLGAG